MKEYKENDEEKLLESDNIKKTYGFSNKYEEKVNSMYTDEELLKMAKKRVEAKNGFFIHLSAFLAVNFFLLFVAGISVVKYVALSWGIGLFIHGVVTSLELNSSRQIAREMKNLEDERKRR